MDQKNMNILRPLINTGKLLLRKAVPICTSISKIFETYTKKRDFSDLGEEHELPGQDIVSYNMTTT